jgi:hypothetical protein
VRPELGPEHEGKFVVIDVGSGDYEVSDDDDEAFGRAEEGHPEAVLFVCPRKAGADADARAEQIDEQEVGTGYASVMSYILAATLNPAGAKGFEKLSFTNFTVMTFALMPVSVAGGTICTPIDPVHDALEQPL